nr:MAG TPA: hypothetical protein [Caudoviricetes sp.]
MGDFPHPPMMPQNKETPRPSSWRGRQRKRTAVDW